MKTLDFIISGRRRSPFSEVEPRYARHHTWVAIGVGVAGAAASVYGANKQSKAAKDAAATNAGAQDAQNQSAWASYLMSRGVNPQGAATGEIPTNPQAINAKLPLWANAAFSSGPVGWRKKGSGGAPVGTLGQLPMAPGQSTADALTSNATPAGSNPSTASKLGTYAINAAAPGLGTVLSGKPVTVGNVLKDALNPFGWF